MDVELKSGKLKGVIGEYRYNSGEIEAYKIEKESLIKINGKDYIPLYSYLDPRRKDLPSVSLYKSGEIKGISFEEATEIETKYGVFSVEKVTFYENWKIKRLFPLDGKISGYWTEEDEYKLSKAYDFNFNFGNFKIKVISICLYDSGEIKSLTLWSKEKINVKINDKTIIVRNGIALYETGEIKSIEPAFPVKINTPIGDIECFDKNAIGISGDINSLEFYKSGKVKSLITGANIIYVYEGQTLIAKYSPEEQYIYPFSDEKELINIKFSFNDNEVIINNSNIYSLNKYEFVVKKYSNKLFLAGDLLK